MLKCPHLVKSVAAVVVPSLLFVLLVLQLSYCRNKLILRNSYLLESLPQHSDWVWDALSGTAHSTLFSNSSTLELVPDHTLGSKDAQLMLDDDFGSDQNYHRTVLLPGLPTLTVHYIWCIEGYFELGHYLAILSVVHQLQPDQIVIHYRKRPRTDPQGYWRWLEDLQRNVIMLSMRPLSNYRICSHDLSAGVTHDPYDFLDPYGVFLLGEVVVRNLTRSDIKDLMVSSFSQIQSSSYSKTVSEDDLRKSQVFIVPGTEPYHMSQSAGRVVISCPSMADVNRLKVPADTKCISINSYIVPDELLKRDNNFNRFARSIMYGTPHVINVYMSQAVQIPNTVHVILIDGPAEITPLLYVSIKSAYMRGKAGDVFVHGPNSPSGVLWERLHKRDEIKVKYIPTPSSQQLNTKHAAMVYALYTLLQHGGIVHFGDVVFLSPIPSSSRHADAIATLLYSEYRQKHPSINTAILAGSRGSTFIESVLARLRQEDLKWPDATANDVATHVSETNPESLLLDYRLTSHQKCDDRRCRVAGGYSSPKQTYSTRLIWATDQPDSLDNLQLVEGPSKSDIKEIVEASYFMHIESVS